MTDAVPRVAQAQGYEALPGWELVGPGLADLAAGRHTVPSALVALASGRLLALEIAVPVRDRVGSPEALYVLVVAEVGERRAHARYNALRRRLTSFINAVAAAPGAGLTEPDSDARGR